MKSAVLFTLTLLSVATHAQVFDQDAFTELYKNTQFKKCEERICYPPSSQELNGRLQSFKEMQKIAIEQINKKLKGVDVLTSIAKNFSDETRFNDNSVAQTYSALAYHNLKTAKNLENLLVFNIEQIGQINFESMLAVISKATDAKDLAAAVTRANDTSRLVFDRTLDVHGDFKPSSDVQFEYFLNPSSTECNLGGLPGKNVDFLKWIVGSTRSQTLKVKCLEASSVQLLRSDLYKTGLPFGEKICPEYDKEKHTLTVYYLKTSIYSRHTFESCNSRDYVTSDYPLASLLMRYYKQYPVTAQDGSKRAP